MALSPFDPMALERWDPFREMRSLREAMDRMMGSAEWPLPRWTEGDRFRPALDVSETDTEYHINVSLPGMRPEDVKISVQGSCVAIEGERKEEREPKEGERSLYRERRYGSFSRSLTLPMPVNTDQARAEFEHGELRLVLPKAETARPKQIKIQPAIEAGKAQREQVKVS